MIAYLLKNNTHYMYFGFKDYEEGVANYSGLKNDIATTNGYMPKSNPDNVKTLVPNTYFSGVDEDINVLLGKLKEIGTIETMLVVGTNKFSFYLMHGDSHDGIKDSLFKDKDFMKDIRTKVKTGTKTDTVNQLIKELSMLPSGTWVFEDKKYWEAKVVKPTMLTGKKIVYFPTLDKYDGKHLYLTTNVKETDELGKQISSINYSILMGEEIPEVTNLINMFNLDLGHPIVIKTDVLFGKDNIRVMKYGKIFTKQYAGVVELKYPNDNVVALCYTPSGMMMVLRDDLMGVLNIFKNKSGVDITDKIYIDDMIRHSGNKFSVDVEVEGFKIRVISSIDTFDRNHFKRIEKLKPTVSVICHNRQDVLKYFTVIKTDKDTVISYAPFNNLSFK